MTSKPSLLDLTITEALAAMESGELTAVQLVQYYLDRISVYDDELTGTYLNSIVTISPDVLEQAEKLDKMRAEGTILGPLHGIPIVVKDSFNVKDLATTGAVRGFEDFVSDDDAFVVEKMREAGAIILGKTNMDSFASGVRGFSNLFGGTRNPYNLNKETGGSSSGTGSAIAANFAMGGTGGETGGSIVIPSAANSLVGIKPSRGLISVDGTIPLSPFRDVIGPITRSVTDTAIMMDVMVQEDPDDLWFDYKPEGSDDRPGSYASPEVLNDKALEGKVLAVPKIYVGKDQKLGEGFTLDPEIEKLFEDAKKTLEEQGATVIEVDTAPYLSKWLNREEEWDYGWPDEEQFPNWNRESTAYYLEEFIKNLNNPEIDSLLDVKNVITGEFSDTALVQTLTALEEGIPRSFQDELLQTVLNALEQWRVNDFEPFVKAMGIDAFVFPTLRATIPDELGPAASVPFDRNADAESNVMGLPVITVPMGYTSGNAPASLSIMGDYYGEAEIIGYAYDFEQATKYRERPITVPELKDTDELIYGGSMGRETGKTFVLQPGAGRKVIADYTIEIDQMKLRQGIGFEDLTITAVGDNTRIQVDQDVLAVLVGVDSSLIAASEFV